MKLLLTKTLTYLLLTAFLVTSMGGVIGCVWCESGSLSNIHINSHIDDHSDNHVDDHTAENVDVHVNVTVGNQVVTLDQHINHKDDACIDSPIHLDQGVLKKTETIKSYPHVSITPIDHNLLLAKTIGSATNRLILDTQPRISHAIITHRTVVLLS